MRLQDDRTRPSKARGFRRLSFAVIIVFTATAARAVLFETAPSEIKIPSYTPVRIPFRPGQRLIYHVSWAGIPAAGATIAMHSDPTDPKLLTGEVSVATNKLVDLVYRMRDYVRENFARGSLAPRDVYIRQAENRRIEEYIINFDQRAGMVDMLKRNRRRSEDVKFQSPNPVGPISGPLMALAQPLTVGSALVFDVFVGHNRYVIALKAERRERLRTALGEFDTLRITPTLLYLSDNQVRTKAREVTVWVSADNRHLPLRVQAEAFIGHITADLVQVGEVNTAVGHDDSAPDPQPPANSDAREP